MDEASVWDLIEMEKFQEACVRADGEFLSKGDIFPLRNKVFALLQLGKFDDTIRLSKQIIDLTKGSTDSDFIFCGVAHWLAREPESAIKVWKAGLSARYTDAAGGVEIPMLLLFAAVKTQDKKLEGEAYKLLRKVVAGRSAVNWPGPIAQYLIGSIAEGRLLELVDTQPILCDKQSCQAEFYIALKCLTSGDGDGFCKNLNACISHGIVCAVKAEPYLAKGELRILTAK